MSNVKLAIRVRPFTEREQKSEKDRIPVVSVIDDHTVSITNIKVSASGAGDSRERIRRYFADYTFNSACLTSDPNYASQEKVFESIGREVVSSLSRGLSACVLAYGQSATGKTHTMMGSEDQPGLVPRLCRALAETRVEVTVSFLEIYNERVHDLLAGEPLACQSLPRRVGNARKDLRVREHPERGPYVQNLRRVAVSDLENLLSLVEEGARRRRTAPTRRNPSSSRSHALLELATPTATLHLADLAGSEKASWEGSGEGRLKEGANINKSLVALSNVISALVSGRHRSRFVPYRDSALTWLLKDCFTGGAATFIIATVSPSVACYGESASTLRWAERARQLRSPRTLTCGPNAASRAALQAQLNQLLAELATHHIHFNCHTGKIFYEDSHWALQPNNNVLSKVEIKTDSNIGNFMNMFNINAEHNSQNSESTASSVASGSSDVLNAMDKNLDIKEEITKEVDKLLAPAFERTRSGSDFQAIAPLRHKKRQYKSQEILPIDKTLQVSRIKMQSTPGQSQEDISGIQSKDTTKPHVPILYDNQRAEIVASVTERLYSKLKKKEEAVVSKVENVVDKKIMEPLSELKICTNARQRLVEMSQKAMRHKGRRIGIPAFTQTRYTVTRVRDQGVDVQSDLETYMLTKNRNYTLQKDVATETVIMTPRCKEVAAGPKSSSLSYMDKGTETESKQVVHKNTLVMTDITAKCDRCSQTPAAVVPPPRRKRRPKPSVNNDSHRCCTEEHAASSVPSVISINISQAYSLDSESQSSEENIDYRSTDDTNDDKTPYSKPTTVSTTPDLLTNHNNVETCVYNEGYKSDNVNENIKMLTNKSDLPTQKKPNITILKESVEFLEDCMEEISLPRVTVGSVRVHDHDEIKDMILGRNENVYPYNIVLSPPRENNPRIVKFKDDDATPALSVASQTSWEWTKNGKTSKSTKSDSTQSDNECTDIGVDNNVTLTSDSTDSSKVESNSFAWKRCNNKIDLNKSLSQGYLPVYKSNSKRYRSARTKLYKEFLGLDCKNDILDYNAKDTNSSDSTGNEEAHNSFRQRRQFFEDKLRRDYVPYQFGEVEKNLLESCNSLDASVNKYESYLKNYHAKRSHSVPEAPLRSPKEYLKHLVQIRRDVVNTQYDTTY